MIEGQSGKESERGPALARTLENLSDQGRFESAVLSSGEGLPLAVGSSAYDTDTLAAMVALVRGFVQQAQAELRLESIDEVSIVTEDKVRLVCRYFTVGEEALTLAVIAPPDQSYRRLTNWALRKIKTIL
jgi:predicted regulator of Ras-like GTPase activity (Roadblock/LC7/MglB family)